MSESTPRSKQDSTSKPEYPREGCPACLHPVVAVEVMCDMDEPHERWNCTNKACGAEEMDEFDLVVVHSTDEMAASEDDEGETLDPAALLKAGKVMPALAEWVKKAVAS